VNLNRERVMPTHRESSSCRHHRPWLRRPGGTGGGARGAPASLRSGANALFLPPLLLATLALTAFPAEGQAPRYTVDDFMTVSEVREFVWAPDGAALYLVSNAGDTGTWEVFRVPGAGGTPAQLTGQHDPAFATTPVADRSEPKEDLAITRDGSRLFFASARYFERYTNLFSLSLVSGEVTQHTFHDGVIETAPAPSPDGRTLAYFDRRGGGTKIHLLDLDSPRSWPRLLDPGPGTERSPIWSPDGRSLAFIRAGAIWVRDLEEGEARAVVAPGYAGVGSPVWSPDGSRMAVSSNRSGFSQIAVVDVATGELTPITYAPRDHSSPTWSPDGRRLAFMVADGLGMTNQLATASSDGSGALEILTSGAGLRSAPAYSPDGSVIAYRETASNRTPDLWTVPAGGGSPRQVTRSMGRVDPERLSVAQDITYPAPADNLPIPGVLLLPPDFEPSRSYPAVVALHGHPGLWGHDMSVDGRSFHHQYLAQQGFVVLAPNPRGSRGLGQGFHDLHTADWGGTDYEDTMAAWDYLASLGYVDMGRIATWGGSGGGYMSFLIAARDSDRVAAQVVRAPVSSFEIESIERYAASGRAWTATREPRREREEFGGSYAEIPGEYDLRSPINFVEGVQVPQLLLHGSRDTAVLIRQSEIWADRMEELGKGHLLEFVRYPDEDHSLGRYRATVRDRLERGLRFLATHLDLPHLLEAEAPGGG
jgi:dipeptidyl aminopeptidase/acylaminoacyl peptidase